MNKQKMHDLITAQKNFNKGRLSALKDEEELYKKWILTSGYQNQIKERLSQIQKEIKEIDIWLKLITPIIISNYITNGLFNKHKLCFRHIHRLRPNF